MSIAFPLHRNESPLPDGDREAILAAPGFGQYFTDHMASAVWTADSGWHDGKVTALAPIPLHPAAAVLHYAQEIFEGLKAFRHADGSVWLFRPDLNARRFVHSARRLALPVLEEEAFIASIEALVRADESWVPAHDGRTSLYIRPFMFGSEAFLGVRPAAQVSYYVIASPAASYFSGGAAGVTLWVSSTYTRAAEGGTGRAKCGGNYAASLAAQVEAHDNGCQQVLYLSEPGRGYLEESGTMNLFLVTADRELITPGLGTILDGVTRASVLKLAAEHDLKAVERQIGIDELRERCAAGSISEMFAAGTAAVITPILAIKGEGFEQVVGDGEPGSSTLAIREHIVGIQSGRLADSHHWLHRVV
ncbi:branched-chain amino acid aminotransferase [Micromonospora coxensis]|uniref:Branched-chain-amino-acid aminotransferase n=1 Tax=Micromonospora coxensis TaxID=356852 RepID=A0A1C5K2D3_9ACTN|nr:branched-chain amino acid aminotransferase [Micromonospora coxensis]SCG76953.1 branched-chain amino acid aminotransferase [Micromonospora coxensis]